MLVFFRISVCKRNYENLYAFERVMKFFFVINVIDDVNIY